MALTPQQIDIARALASRAQNHNRINYRELAREIGHYHPTGRGLGGDLWAVLNFTRENQLPCLTSILVRAGTHSPPDDALRYIAEVYGPLDIPAEQQRVFEFDWAQVPELAFTANAEAEIDFNRIFASRVYGFDTANWGMLGFTAEVTRENRFEAMQGEPIYVVFFCSPNAQEIDESGGQVTIAPEHRGRALGIVEVLPTRAAPDTHLSERAREEMISLWGRLRWTFGLEISRAWRFEVPPWTREVLPHARSLSWEVTRDVVPLTEEEKTLIRQYPLDEVDVFGQRRRLARVAERDPMHTTYLAICDAPSVLRRARAPEGTKLVKIGVSGNTNRRLGELNGHHYARIFEVLFRMYATHRWPSQDEALARETAALEWAADNTHHASGEYFFMTDSQITEAVLKVKPPTRVR